MKKLQYVHMVQQEPDEEDKKYIECLVLSHNEMLNLIFNTANKFTVMNKDPVKKTDEKLGVPLAFTKIFEDIMEQMNSDADDIKYHKKNSDIQIEFENKTIWNDGCDFEPII